MFIPFQQVSLIKKCFYEEHNYKKQFLFLRPMRDEFHRHFMRVRPMVRKRLKEFEKFLGHDDEKLFEEMTYCVFAANSSASMADSALKILKPILWTASLEDYQKAVHKKVRFYNVRSKYLYHNREKIMELGGLKIHLNEKTPHERRDFIRKHFKGFGLKESSHFLRNIGFRGYCIVDKHVLNVMKDLDVLKTNVPPKNENEYFKIEDKIKKFAKENNYDVDELDLGMWSFKTGKVMR